MTSEHPNPNVSDANVSDANVSDANLLAPNVLAPNVLAPEPSASPEPIALTPETASESIAHPEQATPQATPHVRSLLSPATFRTQAARLKPLLLAEWPQLREVDWHREDLDAVITAIATQTRHTRTLIHHQISELSTLIEAPVRSADPTGTGSDVAAARETGDRPEVKSEVDQWLDGLEARAEAIARQLRQEVWPEVRERAQQRVGPVLLLTLVVGVAIGWSLRGSRRGNR